MLSFVRLEGVQYTLLGDSTVEYHFIFSFSYTDPTALFCIVSILTAVNDCLLNFQLNPCPAEVVRELLKYGAHIDTVNYEGETPEALLHKTSQNISSIVNPLQYTTLKCLAARTVKNYRLPYRNVVPQCLHSTVITH